MKSITAPNGRIYSNFLSPGSGETYQPAATTPQLPSQPAEILGKCAHCITLQK